MSNIEARDAEAADCSDWNQAWSAVAQLAAARNATLRELGQHEADAAHLAMPASFEVAAELASVHEPPLEVADPRRAHAELVSSIAVESAPLETLAKVAAPFAPVAPDQLARDMAEIEQAAAALRRAEPALELQTTALVHVEPPPSSHSVWLLVAVIWLTAVAVVSCAVGTAALLLS